MPAGEPLAGDTPSAAEHGGPPAAELGVEVPVYCVLTRFGLRRPRDLATTYRDYRRLVRVIEGAEVPGLLRNAFLIENPTTCYSLSLWSQRPFFSAEVPQHVETARRVFGRLDFDSEHGPELWSTQWQLTSVTNNLNWPGLDLRSVLAGDGRAA